MDSDSPVKDILYEELTKISENSIQLEISKNNISKVISEIISNALPRIEQISHNFDEDYGIFAESLLHYFLTLAMIPSQRKVSKNSIEIDISIPDLRTLESNPKDVLIIVFPKTSDKKLIQKRILDIKQIQTIDENIWIVMHGNFESKNKIYQINNNSLNKILDDIKKFLSTKKQNKFKIMKS